MIVVATLVPLVIGCRASAEYEGLIDDDGGFGSTDPGADAAARYRAAAEYSLAHGGLAVLVVEGDDVVFEVAQNGHDLRRGHHVFSGTKSFGCALAMAAVADQRLTLDESVSATFGEFAGDRRAPMTVRHLLDFTSGLAEDPLRISLDGLKEKQRFPDKYALARELPLEHEPGTRYSYGASHLTLFGALIAAKLKPAGEDVLAYLRRRVLDPIGFRYSGWNSDPSGHPMLAFGAWTTPRSWARYGVLLRDDGRFRGREVLPAGLLRQCFVGSAAMPVYGLTFWLNEPLPIEKREDIPDAIENRLAEAGRALLPDGPADLVAAAGYKDNRLYVIPSLGLVVVRFGDGDRDWKDADFLRPLLLGR